jgi:RNA polymerase sigma-70 factor (ECF subfamily)
MYVDPRRTTSDELVQHKQFLERLATRLTRDPDLAGDLVQDTWLAALRNPPRREGPVRAWLATVMRHLHINRLRSETRALQRQRLLRALPDECSSDEAAEVLELQARIAGALARLEPAQHEVLKLRYLDGLPPRAIAERLGLPVETVRTRIKRGTERLRALLQQQSPSRRSRIAGLLLVARRPFERLRSWLRPRPGHVRSALFCAALLLGVALLRFAAEARREPAASSAGSASSLLADRRASGEPAAAVPAERPSTAPDARAPATALARGLQVQLRWALDGSPAAGVRLALERIEGARARGPAQILESDAQGVVACAQAEPGRWLLSPWLGPPTTVDLPRGEPLRVELELPPGIEVEGTVYNAARLLPPRKATLWGSFPGRADLLFSVGTADQDGNFRLQDIDELAWIGACSPRSAPSSLLQAGSGAHFAGAVPPLELELGPNRTYQRVVRLLVKDEAGRPIAGAEAELVGDAGARYDGPTSRWMLRPDSETGRTDAQGHVWIAREAGGLEALQVRARGFAPQRLTPAPQSTSIEVVLQRESVVCGRLLSIDPGLVLEGVRVVASAAELARPIVARCDADGTFRLEGLPSGAVTIEAGIDDGLPGAAHADVPLETGQVCSSLELPYSCSGDIRGNLVDESGRPRAGWLVTLQDPDGELDFSDGLFGPSSGARRATTDAAGGFAFEGCAAREHFVCVYPPSLSQGAGDHVRAFPSSTPLRICAGTHPGARVRGRYRDPDSATCPRLLLCSRMLERVEWLALAPRDGSFCAAGLPEGEYLLGTLAPDSGVVPLQPFVLGRDAELDLGALAAPRPGHVRLHAHDINGAVPERLWVTYGSLQCPGARKPKGLPKWVCRDAQGEFDLGDFSPGKFLLVARMPDQQRVQGTATVEAGATIAVELKP